MRNLSRAVVFFAFLSAGILSANFIWAAEKVDINTAPLEDLTKIIHIGEVRALELISLRPFASLDDLARIKGIGEARIKDIKEQGLAWVGQQPQSQAQAQVQPETAENNPLPSAMPGEKSNEVAKESGEGPNLQAPETSGSSSVLSTTFVLAIFSGAIILFLKKSLKQVRMKKT